MTDGIGGGFLDNPVQAGLQGISKRRASTVTTRRDPRERAADDLVRRCFRAERANQLWVADMTYVPTWAGFIYLAVVMDVFLIIVADLFFGGVPAVRLPGPKPEAVP